MKIFTISFLLALIALCAVLYFLPDKIRTTVQTTAQEGYGVAATTYPIWVLTREVLDGTGIEAELLTPPDAGCPHDYVLTPNDLMKVSAARKPLLLFKNGAGLDDHICKAALSAGKGVVAIDTGAGIEVIGGDDDDDHDHDAEDDHDEHEEHEGEGDHDGHEAEGHHHHHHGGENGHFFASPYEARKIVATIADELAKSDPLHAGKFRENAAKLDKRLQMLGDSFKAQLEPYADKHVAAQHNVFDYLLRDCGFETPLAIFADPETPPSPAEITEMTKEFKEHGVKVIFTEPQYPDELAKLIGKETGAAVVKIDPVASGPADPPAGYYFDVMNRNLEIMKKALAE
ncbi:MAG: zinc ABC transporter substrate-binding protein [Lentisphaeria bacterium]|nr:zinc ABC transporter substrate-binding protein [Lentisphaeria bacterium]MBR3505742.1 zinc ABC transporter substrate-binding protein [Lentisphaeria bacterium]